MYFDGKEYYNKGDSRRLLQKNYRKQGKDVIAICLNTGEVYRFSSIREAARATHTHASNVSHVINGIEQRQTGGFFFAYDDGSFKFE